MLSSAPRYQGPYQSLALGVGETLVVLGVFSHQRWWHIGGVGRGCSRHPGEVLRGLWVAGGLLPAILSLSLEPLQAAGWPGLERLTAGCRASVVWMLEALEGLPESERAKYFDVTGQCRDRWDQTQLLGPVSGRMRWQSSVSVT